MISSTSFTTCVNLHPAASLLCLLRFTQPASTPYFPFSMTSARILFLLLLLHLAHASPTGSSSERLEPRSPLLTHSDPLIPSNVRLSGLSERSTHDPSAADPAIHHSTYAEPRHAHPPSDHIIWVKPLGVDSAVSMSSPVIARQHSRRNLIRRDENPNSCDGSLATPVVAGIAIGCFIAGVLTSAIVFLSYRVCRARRVQQVTPASVPYPPLSTQHFSRNAHHRGGRLREASSSNPSLLLPVRHPHTPHSSSQASLGQYTRSQTTSRLAGSQTSEPRLQSSRAREKRHPAPASASTGTSGDSSRQDVEELKQQIYAIKEQIKWMKKTRKGPGPQGQPPPDNGLS